MALPYTDGTVAYGSRVLTFSTAGAMVADSVEINRAAVIVERTSELGAPSGWVAIPGAVTCTATVQVVTSGTLPTQGETFSIVYETFVVTEVSQPEEKAGLKVARITARKDTES